VTTLWERGGAPLHFLVVHLSFAFDSSATVLRWVSVVFAVAAVPLCYDLGRRLGGRFAGITAAVVAAGSGMLAVYGSFGRMYALFAFVAALAADLFVRALDLRTQRAALWAAAAAWLLPAVHPYGGIVVGLEGLVALAVWRGRPLRPVLPVAAIGLALLPFLIADLRLANRFEVTSNTEHRLATRHEAWNQLTDAVRGFAGGSGWTFVVFLVLAAAGVLLLAPRRPSFVAWGLLAFALPPVLSTFVHTGRSPDLSPRHLVFALPFWAAFIGFAVSRIPARAVAVVAVAAVAAVSPQGIHDPRSITYTAKLGTEQALAAPSAWLRERIEANDVLYPYSSLFLAALPEAGKAIALPRAQTGPILDVLRRADFPVARVFVAVPVGTTRIDLVGARGLRLAPFPSWLVVELRGEFGDRASILRAIDDALENLRKRLQPPLPDALAGWFELNTSVLCKAVRQLGSECGR
jgi:4-amino-4-deoxy-L-arabinose transferase-like glycosyltransferase